MKPYPIDPNAMAIFMKELVNQSVSARLSADLYEHYLTQPINQYDDINDRIFHAAQGILTAGALMSKILWPPPHPRPDWCHCDAPAGRLRQYNRSVERCEAMRAALNITDELSDRFVRNGIEHVDDRIDTLFAQDPEGGFADRMIGPTEMMPDDVPRSRYVRHLDNRTHVMTAAGSSVSLIELMDTIGAVRTRALAWINERSR